MALKGKSVVVEVSTDDVTYSTVAEINDVDTPFEADNIDVTTFGDSYIERIQGLKDASWSLSGFYDPTDTNGQVAIRSAWAGDTTLYARVSYDGGVTTFKQQVKVSSFGISAAVDGAVEVSIDLEGTGTVTIA